MLEKLKVMQSDLPARYIVQEVYTHLDEKVPYVEIVGMPRFFSATTDNIHCYFEEHTFLAYQVATGYEPQLEGTGPWTEFWHTTPNMFLELATDQTITLKAHCGTKDFTRKEFLQAYAEQIKKYK